jgi:hypothetical protein
MSVCMCVREREEAREKRKRRGDRVCL